MADLHLGYSWAQRRRGELGPLADSRTRDKLTSLIDTFHPARVVFLGDLVHAPRPCESERAWITELLTELSLRSNLVAVRGNHDRAFAKEFAAVRVEVVDVWCEGALTAIHGDRLPATVEAGVLILGHLHPSLPVRDAAGAGQKLPVFLASSRCVLLPAFSPFAGGYDLLAGLPRNVLTLFGGEEIQTYATSGTRVVPLGSLRRAVERMFEADRGTPERFRRGRVR